MDKRWLVAVAFLSALLGVLAVVGFTPDTSTPTPAPAPAPAPRAVAVAPRPVLPAAPSPRPSPAPRIPPRQIEVPEPEALDEVYDPSPEGLTTATFARKERLAQCWLDHGGEELGGRFTVHVTVSDGEDGGKVDADVVNPDASQEMVDCVMDAMADATFPTPGDMAVSMIVPIPIPGD